MTKSDEQIVRSDKEIVQNHHYGAQCWVNIINGKLVRQIVNWNGTVEMGRGRTEQEAWHNAAQKIGGRG